MHDACCGTFNGDSRSNSINCVWGLNAMVTVAIDVHCPTCDAEPFNPCVYADTIQNRKRRCVGQPILRDGYPYYHNQRQDVQHDFNWLHGDQYPQNKERLSVWLIEYGDIFAE